MNKKVEKAGCRVSRRAYSAPVAGFVPLKLEERLLSCDKTGIRTQCFQVASQRTS